MHQKVSSPTFTFILLLNVCVTCILELHFRAPTTSKTMSLRCHLRQTNFHIRHKPKPEAYFYVKCNLKPFYLSKLFSPLLGAYGFQTCAHTFLSHVYRHNSFKRSQQVSVFLVINCDVPLWISFNLPTYF